MAKTYRKIRNILSVVIPISDRLREDNLRVVIDNFLPQQSFRDFEIVLVEQVVEEENYQKLYKNLRVDKYVSIRNDINELFSKTWCMNVGAKVSEGTKLLFLDGDIVSDTNYLQAVWNYSKDWFVAWSQTYWLNGLITKKIQETGKIGNMPQESGSGTSLFGNPGMSVCYNRKFFFERFGGHNEGYFAWGGEDNDSAWRAFKLTNEFDPLQYKTLHLWHSGKKRYTRKDNDHWFWMCKKYPSVITKRIKVAGIGKLSGPTIIDITDLRP